MQAKSQDLPRPSSLNVLRLSLHILRHSNQLMRGKTVGPEYLIQATRPQRILRPEATRSRQQYIMSIDMSLPQSMSRVRALLNLLLLCSSFVNGPTAHTTHAHPEAVRTILLASSRALIGRNQSAVWPKGNWALSLAVYLARLADCVRPLAILFCLRFFHRMFLRAWLFKEIVRREQYMQKGPHYLS